MSARLAPEVVEKIREASDIVELVSERVLLIERGKGQWWGRCPFHDDKSPSLSVRVGKGYNCFGCGAKGDAISWVEATEGLGFMDSVRALAARAGLDADGVESPRKVGESPRVVPPAPPGPAWRRACLKCWSIFRDSAEPGNMGSDRWRALASNLCAAGARVHEAHGSLGEEVRNSIAFASALAAGGEIVEWDECAAGNPRMFQVNHMAMGFFTHALMLKVGTGAREYLMERGVASAARLAPVSAAWGIGYAPDRWDALIHYAGRRRFTVEELQVAGLVTEGKRGPVDMWRGRLMFGLKDARGRVVGFAGREMGRGGAKYVNTRETPVYRKRKVLYGLDCAGPEISATGRATVVEGYFDVVAAHQAGVRNVVACCGTAMTEQQLDALVAHGASEVVIVFDGDVGGRDAIASVAGLFRDGVPRVTIASLPDGEDPFDILRKGGRAEWEKIIRDAQPLDPSSYTESARQSVGHR